MAKKKLTPAEEYPDHDTEKRQCTRCNLITHRSFTRCPDCGCQEYGIPLKSELIADKPLKCPQCMILIDDDKSNVEVYSHSETQEQPQVWICMECEWIGTYEDFKGLTAPVVQRTLF